MATLGVCIPKAGRGQDAAGHHNLTQETLRAHGFVPERGGLADVVAELKRSDTIRACISSEDYSLASRSHESLVQLRCAIEEAGYHPKIIIYLRPQVGYCLSMYAEIVKNGNRKPFSVYLHELRQHGTFLWDDAPGPLARYDILLERFGSVFGPGSLMVRRYRRDAPPNALLHSFAQTIVGRPVDLRSFAFPIERFNSTASFGRVLASVGAPISMADLRFAPLDLGGTLKLAAIFSPSSLAVLKRYRVWVPPCEISDLRLALPWRRSRALTSDLARARATFVRVGD